MSESRTFGNVSADLLEEIFTVGRERHGARIEAEDALRGATTTPTPLGSLVLNYALDPDAETVTYTIVRKPMFVADRLIWDGIQSAIEECRRRLA